MKEKILILGNATVDLIFKGKIFDEREIKDRLSLALGGKYVVDDFFQYFGGGGANAAISLARQGFDVSIIAKVGNDVFGHKIESNLQKENIKTKLLRKTATATQTSSILIDSAGNRTIINFRGDADLIDLTAEIKKELKNSPWFVIFSLAKLPKSRKLDFLRFAKDSGSKIFLSLHGTEYFKGFKYLNDYFQLTDIMHLNAHECADIFGGNADDFDYHRTNFAKKLKVPILVVSYDIKGSFAYTKEQIYYQPIIDTKKKVDTTGAGDAFASGFLGKYIKTADIQASLEFATKNATSVIEHYGAQNGLLFDKTP